MGDMAAVDGGRNASLFVSNVLNGTVAGGGQIVDQGTVVRLNLQVSRSSMPLLESVTVIGSGFAERTDPAALVIGPTGVALSQDGHLLYVADSLNNRVVAIEEPLRRSGSGGTGRTVTRGGALNDPLGLTLALNGDILTVNGDDGFLVETSKDGHQLHKMLLDDNGNPPGAGALFGLAVVKKQGTYFVDDNTNTLNLLH
jgi:DNA-binding beta-propeller fold protein YncE